MADQRQDQQYDESEKSLKITAMTLDMNLKEGEHTAKIGKASRASRALSHILAGCSNKEIRELKEEYYELKKETLEEAISSCTWGLYEDALLKLCQGARSEGPADGAQVEHDAEALYNAARKKLGTDETSLLEILCTRNREQVEAIKTAYQKKYGSSLEEDIRKDTHGLFEDDNFGDLMVMLLECAPPPPTAE